MVTGSAIGELDWRLCAGQHSLFFLSPATVLSAAPWRRGRAGGFTLGQMDAEQTGNPSN
jgi:hypothetical protein